MGFLARFNTCDKWNKNVVIRFLVDTNVDNEPSSQDLTCCADGFFLKNPRSAQRSAISFSGTGFAQRCDSRCCAHDTKNCRMVVIRLGDVAVYGAVHNL